MSQFTSCSKRKPLPSCQITLTDYFFRRSILYLPLKFAKSIGLYNRQCDITIIDEKERHWEMMLSSKTSNYYSYISKGWKDLRLANSFKPGDILIFQLIKNGEKPILKCYTSQKKKAHVDREAEKQRKDKEVGNNDNNFGEIEVLEFETESVTKGKSKKGKKVTQCEKFQSTSEWVDSLIITPCSQQTTHNEWGDVNVYGRQEVIHMVDGGVKVANSVLISKIQRRLDALGGMELNNTKGTIEVCANSGGQGDLLEENQSQNRPRTRFGRAPILPTSPTRKVQKNKKFQLPIPM